MRFVKRDDGSYALEGLTEADARLLGRLTPEQLAASWREWIRRLEEEQEPAAGSK